MDDVELQDLFLHVHVLKARWLPKMDRYGLSDPFVKLRVNDQKATTSIQRYTLNPNWNQHFTFKVGDFEKKLLIDVFDWNDPLKFSKDDFIGTVAIKVAEIEYDRPLRGWWKLRKREDGPQVKGEIWLALLIDSKPDEYYTPPRSNIFGFSSEPAPSVINPKRGEKEECGCYTLKTGLHFRIEVKYENERAKILGISWGKPSKPLDPPHWTDRSQKHFKERDFSDDWEIGDFHIEQFIYSKSPPSLDKSGWQYAAGFNGPWFPVRHTAHRVRRRKWVRSLTWHGVNDGCAPSYDGNIDLDSVTGKDDMISLESAISMNPQKLAKNSQRRLARSESHSEIKSPRQLQRQLNKATSFIPQKDGTWECSRCGASAARDQTYCNICDEMKDNDTRRATHSKRAASSKEQRRRSLSTKSQKYHHKTRRRRHETEKPRSHSLQGKEFKVVISAHEQRTRLLNADLKSFTMTGPELRGMADERSRQTSSTDVADDYVDAHVSSDEEFEDVPDAEKSTLQTLTQNKEKYSEEVRDVLSTIEDNLSNNRPPLLTLKKSASLTVPSPTTRSREDSHMIFAKKLENVKVVTPAQVESLVKGLRIDIIPMSDVVFSQEIGCGGSALVYQATYHGDDIAVKVFRGLLSDQNVVKQFLTEISVWKKLHFQRIVPLNAVCFDFEKDWSCVVMPLYSKGSLYTVLKSKITMSWKTRIRITLQIASAMMHLHNRNPKILHRDLKSPNILLDESLNAYVCDFGLAQMKRLSKTIHASLTDDISDEKEQKDETEQTDLCTLSWTAPEAFIESFEFTEACDVYSFGITCAEIATGKLPYPGKSQSQIMYSVLVKHQRPKVKNCPRSYKNLMERCWNEDPKQRPTFQEIVSNLNDMMLSFRKGSEILKKYFYGYRVRRLYCPILRSLNLRTSDHNFRRLLLKAVDDPAIDISVIKRALVLRGTKILHRAKKTKSTSIAERVSLIGKALLRVQRDKTTIGVEFHGTQEFAVLSRVMGDYKVLQSVAGTLAQTHLAYSTDSGFQELQEAVRSAVDLRLENCEEVRNALKAINEIEDVLHRIEVLSREHNYTLLDTTLKQAESMNLKHSAIQEGMQIAQNLNADQVDSKSPDSSTWLAPTPPPRSDSVKNTLTPDKRNARNWTEREVVCWICSKVPAFLRYQTKFMENGVNGESLLFDYTSADDFHEIVEFKPHASRLWREVVNLKREINLD